MAKLRIVSRATNNDTGVAGQFIDPFTPPKVLNQVIPYKLASSGSTVGWRVSALRTVGTTALLPGFIDAINNTNNKWPAVKKFTLYGGTIPTQDHIWDYGWYDTASAQRVSLTGGYYEVPKGMSIPSSGLALVSMDIGTGAALNGKSLTFPVSAATAGASGTATWFSIFVAPTGVLGNVEFKTFPFILAGTVSAPGGGGDIEIPNTSISAYASYSMPPIEIQIPFGFFL